MFFKSIIPKWPKNDQQSTLAWCDSEEELQMSDSLLMSEMAIDDSIHRGTLSKCFGS